MEAVITLRYETGKEAEAVTSAVLPDNVKLPHGLTVETSVDGSKVLTFVKCENRLETFMATLDDLLSCVSVAEKVLSETRED